MTNQTPEIDTLEFEITATAANGIQIPMTVAIGYPKDYGYYAVKAVAEMSSMTTELYQQMLNRSDLSTLQVLMNLQNESDEDDD